MYPVIQDVPTIVIRTNLDGTSLPDRGKAEALASQGGYAPTTIAAAVFNANETVVTVFNGLTEQAFYIPSNTELTFWKNFVIPTSFGCPQDNLYTIKAVRVPGAVDLAGLCLANP